MKDRRFISLFFISVMLLSAVLSFAACGTPMNTGDDYGKNYTVDSAKLNKQYTVSEITDLSVLKDIETVSAAVRDDGDYTSFDLKAETASELIDYISHLRVMPDLKTMESKDKDGIYFSFDNSSGKNYKFSAVKADGEVYMYFDEVLVGERGLSSPSVGFLVSDGGAYTEILNLMSGE